MSDAGLVARPRLGPAAAGRPNFGPAVPAAAALGTFAAAAWALLAGGATGHMSHHVLLGSGHLPRAGAVLAFLGNWQLMVAATMLPPAIPAIAALARRSDRWWAATRAALVTTCAVCAVWTGFAIAVLAGDSLVHRLVGAWPWLAAREGLVTWAVLTLAGIVQLTSIRRHAPAAARTPLRPWRYALDCLGSCWALMLVMCAVALENLLWMAVLAGVMTVQRLPGLGARLAPAVGLVLISLAALAPLPGLVH